METVITKKNWYDFIYVFKLKKYLYETNKDVIEESVYAIIWFFCDVSNYSTEPVKQILEFSVVN